MALELLSSIKLSKCTTTTPKSSSSLPTSRSTSITPLTSKSTSSTLPPSLRLKDDETPRRSSDSAFSFTSVSTRLSLSSAFSSISDIGCTTCTIARVKCQFCEPLSPYHQTSSSLSSLQLSQSSYSSSNEEWRKCEDTQHLTMSTKQIIKNLKKALGRGVRKDARRKKNAEKALQSYFESRAIVGTRTVDFGN